MSNTTLVRKLTRKTIIGAAPKIEESTLLYTIYGVANGTKHSIEDSRGFGEWTALVGSFEAKRSSDGEMFAAPMCFLPEPVNSMIANQIDSKDVESVQFAFEIMVSPSDTPIGYEYTAKPLIQPSLSDPLAELRARALPPVTQPQAQVGAMNL